MIQKGDKMGYNVDGKGAINIVEIEAVRDGIAFSTLNRQPDTKDFTMTFMANTGEGIGLYAGTFLSVERIH